MNDFNHLNKWFLNDSLFLEKLIRNFGLIVITCTVFQNSQLRNLVLVFLFFSFLIQVGIFSWNSRTILATCLKSIWSIELLLWFVLLVPIVISKTIQWLVVTRDPAFYNLSFISYKNGGYPINVWPLDLGIPYGFQVNAPGFDLIQNESKYVSVQGGIGYQKLGSVYHEYFEHSNVTHINVALCILAAILFYFFLREIFSKYRSAIGLRLLILSIPFLYVGLAAFSEPLSMCLGFGLFIIELRKERIGFRIYSTYLCILIFALSLVRIDATLLFSTSIIIKLLFDTLSVGAEIRKTYLTLLLLLVSTFTGQFFFAFFSGAYVNALRREVFYENLLMVMFSIITFLAPIFKEKWRTLMMNATYNFTKWSMLFLIFRPLYPNLTRTDIALKPYYPGGRTYDENTIYSFYWYFGLLAGLFLLLCVWNLPNKLKLFEKPFSNLIMAILLTQIGGYFFTWNVAPDQPWASRRLITLGYPILIILVLAQLNSVETKYISKNFWIQKSTILGEIILFKLGKWKFRVSNFIVIILIFQPFFLALNFLYSAPSRQSIDESMISSCNYIKSNNDSKIPILLFSNELYPLSQTFRSICNVFGATASNSEVDVESVAKDLNAHNSAYLFIPVTNVNDKLEGKDFVGKFNSPVSPVDGPPSDWTQYVFKWRINK